MTFVLTIGSLCRCLSQHHINREPGAATCPNRQVDSNEHETVVALSCTELPKLGEWTRIEIGHIKEGEDKYFLTLSIGGHEVARGDATEFGLWCKRDCQVYILSENETSDAHCLFGSMRGVVILDKN